MKAFDFACSTLDQEALQALTQFIGHIQNVPDAEVTDAGLALKKIFEDKDYDVFLIEDLFTDHAASQVFRHLRLLGVLYPERDQTKRGLCVITYGAQVEEGHCNSHDEFAETLATQLVQGGVSDFSFLSLSSQQSCCLLAQHAQCLEQLQEADKLSALGARLCFKPKLDFEEAVRVIILRQIAP